MITASTTASTRDPHTLDGSPAAASSRPPPAQLSLGFTKRDAEDLNTILRFLTTPCAPLPVFDSETSLPTVLVLAGNALLPLSRALFAHIAQLVQRRADARVTLVITGGIGHSTAYLYAALARAQARDPALRLSWPGPAAPFDGVSEADLLLTLARTTPGLDAAIADGRLCVLVERASTNCGANAVESKRLLDAHGVWPGQLLVVQDPTMHRRTLAGFERAYGEATSQTSRPMPALLGWTLQPEVVVDTNGRLTFETRDRGDEEVPPDELWDPARFASLVLGEIPRLRDDEGGYGPNGAGFIAHVDIPAAVEAAWRRLREKLSL